MVILQEMELSGPKMKNVLIFPKKSFPYIQGNGTL